MSQVSTVALGGLQVVALLLPVVIVTTRFLVPRLEPGDVRLRREKRLNWLQKWVMIGGLASIVLLSVSAILLVWVVLVTYSMPVSLTLGFLLLLAAVLLFAFPIMLILHDQYTNGNVPSLESPR